MKLCPYCGKELPEELQFCPYCMEKLTEETPVGGTRLRQKRLLWLWPIGAALLLLIPLLVWRLWPDAPTEPAPDLLVASSADDSTDKTDPTDSASATTHQTSENTDNSTGTTTTHGKQSQTTDPAVGTTTRTTTGTKKTDKRTSTKASSTAKTSSTATEATCADGHDWAPLTTTVRHDEQGHYVERENGTVKITIYKCAICYQKHDSLEDYYIHFETHLASSDPLVEIFRDRYETDTEYRTTYTQVWVVDQKAYNETVTVGRRCQRCGKTEEND